ncbi:hypothetical protein [Clostridium sp.]|uniref:hypothetical protein n=1 Tax=Clostridium sp. TaxID=1506 RepID=UPI002623A28B|nr:hypothetical protein [Clostridium sp.]
MSKCPFWSSAKENINCYNTCPMYSEDREGEVCPFKELPASNLKNVFANNIENQGIYYSQNRYLNYDE